LKNLKIIIQTQNNLMKNLLFLTLVVIGMNVYSQVAINTEGSLPDNSAILDVNSADKGMLIPRMTAAQREAIISPATGLLIFCTDDNLIYSNNGTPDEPWWLVINSKWYSNGPNIYFVGGKVGIGTSVPSAVLDVIGGNNWDLINGNGDFRLGNSQYRIKMGIALGGGGAGAAGIMQYGQPGGYNVLKLGAQGNYLLYINGETQKVGIGTDNPGATLDVQGSLRVADGAQGTGKVLTSDGDGIASWASDNKHYIGESYGGGIVFYVYDNGYHGLIAPPSDQSSGMQWSNGVTKLTGTTGDGIGSGSMNTAIIVATEIGDNPTGNFAAKVCADYSVTVDGIMYGDWYLPSKYELNLLYVQNGVVGGFTYDYYWSSNEASNIWASAQYYGSGQQYDDGYKSYPCKVRAIRAF
jgi:hypothetical protein